MLPCPKFEHVQTNILAFSYLNCGLIRIKPLFNTLKILRNFFCCIWANVVHFLYHLWTVISCSDCIAQANIKCKREEEMDREQIFFIVMTVKMKRAWEETRKTSAITCKACFGSNVIQWEYPFKLVVDWVLWWAKNIVLKVANFW